MERQNLSIHFGLCVEEQGEGLGNAESRLRAPLLISASSLLCMNVSGQWTREIKMVVCISC